MQQPQPNPDICVVGDALIGFGNAECHRLDVHGNSAANQIYLAEDSRSSVECPCLFLDAAITSCCPWNEL